jgi:tRNA U34 5-methylaminomethyl-2-thiouridine-forming methyltransferase MnmC
MNFPVVITGDGSPTLLHRSSGEHYHSTYGAVTESRHVFIGCGLQDLIPSRTPLRILEVGFGTGLNALLTLAEAEANQTQVDYHAIEPHLVSQEMMQQLDYPAAIRNGHLSDAFRLLHTSPTAIRQKITGYFTLTKLPVKLEAADLPKDYYHLVYFDTFSPQVQPELWTPAVFSNLHPSLKRGGTLVTYCSKGSVRRALTEAGFSVGKLPGPPGKRHILRAIA